MSSLRTASASGKIILSGEYAVVFRYRGIAIPSELRVDVTFVESPELASSTVEWKQKNVEKLWQDYSEKIAEKIEKISGIRGKFLIDNHLPLGKGLGSSTALVIAMTKAALGEDSEATAREIEDIVNPGNSGLDFTVIWHEKPLVFKKGSAPEFIELPKKLLSKIQLKDTGKPNETTPELVAWVQERKGELQQALNTIGNCTERILQGENLEAVIRDHHRAQVTLGVVPKDVQELIATIESGGGAAKVLGAGARTGGGGMVLVLHE